MFFKKLVISILSGALILGCAGENQPYLKTDEMSFAKSEGKCLTDFALTINKYVNAKLNEQQVKNFWNCIIGSIGLFSNFVNGSNAHAYTANELQKFLNTFFLKANSRLSNELMASIMKLKQVFIGGSVDELTKVELQKGVEVLRSFRKFTISAHPYIQLLTLSKNLKQPRLDYSEQELETAIRVIHEIGQDLGQMLDKNKTQYAFNEFKRFLILLDTEIDPDDKEVNRFIDFIPVSAALKSIFVGTDAHAIHGDEWSSFFNVVIKVYSGALRAYYHIDPEHWDHGEGLEQLTKIVEIAFDLIQTGLEVNNNNITQEKLNFLIEATESFSPLPFGLSVTNAQLAVHSLVQHVLKPWTLRDHNKSDNFNPLALRTIKYEFARWYESQKYANEIASHRISKRHNDILNDDIYTPVEELNRVINSPVKMILMPDGRLNLSYEAKHSHYDLKSLTALNWQRALSRLLIRGYAINNQQRMSVKGLTLSQYLKAFHDFGDIAIALKLLKPLDGIDGASKAIEIFAQDSFQEANLFLPDSNGSNYFELEEAVQYISYVTTGLESGNDFFNAVVNVCQKRQESGEKCKLAREEEGNSESPVTSVDLKLFREMFHTNAEKIFGHMQSLLEYYNHQNHNPSFKRKFLRYIETAIGNNDVREKNNLIPLSEVVRMVVVLQYVETFFLVYDSDEDGVLAYNESSKAFPKFDKFLQEVSEDIDSSKRAESMFYYLIEKGKVPVTIWEKIKYFVTWESVPSRWETAKGDRLKILKILATLATENSKK